MKHLTRNLLIALFAIAMSAISASARIPQTQQGAKDEPAQAAPPAGAPAAAETKPVAEKAAEAKPEAAKEAGKKEEKEEDSEAAFKYSASVKWLASKTGLSVTTAYWVFVLINFAIVAGAILSFMKKKLPGAFRDRTASIQQQIQEARKASEEANRRLAEIENKLSRLGVDIDTMRSEGEKSARSEEERLRAAAEEDRKKIVTASEAEIVAAANAARRELKTYAAELAIDLAGKRIRVEEAADQTLVREFAGRLGKDGK